MVIWAAISTIFSTRFKWLIFYFLQTIRELAPASGVARRFKLAIHAPFKTMQRARALACIKAVSWALSSASKSPRVYMVNLKLGQ
jgi:hypothetical protein